MSEELYLEIFRKFLKNAARWIQLLLYGLPFQGGEVSPLKLFWKGVPNESANHSYSLHHFDRASKSRLKGVGGNPRFGFPVDANVAVGGPGLDAADKYYSFYYFWKDCSEVYIHASLPSNTIAGSEFLWPSRPREHQHQPRCWESSTLSRQFQVRLLVDQSYRRLQSHSEQPNRRRRKLGERNARLFALVCEKALQDKTGRRCSWKWPGHGRWGWGRKGVWGRLEHSLDRLAEYGQPYQQGYDAEGRLRGKRKRLGRGVQ